MGNENDLRLFINREQRKKKRQKNVNKHIRIANSILRKGYGPSKQHEYETHIQKANRLIKRYTDNPIVKLEKVTS